MNWCFGIINNKLSEVYFEKKRGKTVFIGHCYVNESGYTTKKEKRWIEKDTTKVKLIYRKGKYKEKNS